MREGIVIFARSSLPLWRLVGLSGTGNRPLFIALMHNPELGGSIVARLVAARVVVTQDEMKLTRMRTIRHGRTDRDNASRTPRYPKRGRIEDERGNLYRGKDVSEGNAE